MTLGEPIPLNTAILQLMQFFHQKHNFKGILAVN